MSDQGFNDFVVGVVWWGIEEQIHAVMREMDALPHGLRSLRQARRLGREFERLTEARKVVNSLHSWADGPSVVDGVGEVSP